MGDVAVPLEEITAKVNTARAQSEALAIFTIEWPYSRGFDGAKEQIAITIDTATALEQAITDYTIHFGEIAGKHSDVHGDIEPDEITIEIDPAAVSSFLSAHPSGHEYNHSFLHRLHEHFEEGQHENVPLHHHNAVREALRMSAITEAPTW